MLPPLGIGTAPLGGLFRDVSEAETVATVEEAAKAGIRYFDTAPRCGHGQAESLL